MPEQLETALDLCLFLYFLNPQFARASARTARHFITDFDYSNITDTDEQKALDDYLHYTLQLPAFMAEVGDEHGCYGNAFCRVYLPFDRFLIDPRRPTTYAVSHFGREAKFHWQKMQYEVPDPLNAGKKIFLSFRDHPSKDPSRIKLRKVDPRRIIIRHNMISGTSDYIYRFESEIIDDVKKGRLHIVNEMPMAMLQAIRQNQDFLFAPDQIYHFKEATVSRVSNHGWGLPAVISNYRNLHQLQVYRKIDEAIGLDYMLPFRLFSALPNTSPGDMTKNFILGQWNRQIKTVIDSRRRDKFAMHSLPFPVNYQEVGAEGKQLVPKDLIEWQTKALLDGAGFPQELFEGSLGYQEIPTALRMFENSFIFIHTGYNQLTQWVVKKVRSYLNQPKAHVMVQLPSIADSLEAKQMLFQLVSIGEVSREKGYKGLGIDDILVDAKARIKEDMDIQRERAKGQQELQQQLESGTLSAPAGGQGGGAGGSAPGGPSGAGGQTPGDVTNDAQSLAQYWLSIQSDGERAKAMAATRSQNENLYSLAKEKMEQMRRGGQSQGRQAVAQQAQQQGPPPGGVNSMGG